MLDTRRFLILEFCLLCLVLPTVIIVFHLGKWMFLFLWAALMVCTLRYRRIPSAQKLPLWNWAAVNRRNMIPVLLRFGLGTAVLCVFILLLKPEIFLSLPRERPELYARLMLLYPLFSAVPQEFIFCSYFFVRFAPLFPGKSQIVWVSAVVFAYAHVLYINPVAPVLGLVAGYIFASTFQRTKSLALVSIEHALYGNMIFTVGLGLYFYSGGIPD